MVCQYLIKCLDLFRREASGFAFEKGLQSVSRRPVFLSPPDWVDQ